MPFILQNFLSFCSKVKKSPFLCRAMKEEWGILGHVELTGPTADRKLGQVHPDESSQWAAGVDR
jgi:hypothetical protein